ncbi:hypothetical protein ACFORO_19890 [Amycolatopsis halotolerans]|uniref:Chagasin family peptidase inhibitor I42 n=1 Tax=Amycolatopsis halotolerans TaxID=330083 RepID=A0ABV7QJW3_9PSEU
MKTTKYAAVAATGLALIASAVATTPAAAEPSGRIVLTNTENGRSVHAKIGDTIEVRLTGYRDSGVTYSWSIPQSAEPQVLHRVAGAAKPDGGASAVFHAEQEGTVTLSAARACYPGAGHGCPHVVTPWKATATVK